MKGKCLLRNENESENTGFVEVVKFLTLKLQRCSKMEVLSWHGGSELDDGAFRWFRAHARQNLWSKPNVAETMRDSVMAYFGTVAVASAGGLLHIVFMTFSSWWIDEELVASCAAMCVPLH